MFYKNCRSKYLLPLDVSKNTIWVTNSDSDLGLDCLCLPVPILGVNMVKKKIFLC